MNLKVDLDLLLELSLQESRGEGECYLNLNDGEFSYIPQGIIEALNDETKYEKLESWEKELAEETENIIMNYSDRYLYIPIISDEVLTAAMEGFIKVLPEEEKNKVNKEIDWSNPFLTFNRAVLNHGILDEYYTFRDNYLKEYLLNWLANNQIKA